MPNYKTKNMFKKLIFILTFLLIGFNSTAQDESLPVKNLKNL